MAYQVGSAYVSVLPSLDGFSKAVDQQINRISPVAEIASRLDDSGVISALDRIRNQKTVTAVRADMDDSGVVGALDRLRNQTTETGVRADLDDSQAQSALDRLRSANTTTNVGANLDDSQARSALDALRSNTTIVVIDAQLNEGGIRGALSGISDAAGREGKEAGDELGSNTESAFGGWKGKLMAGGAAIGLAVGAAVVQAMDVEAANDKLAAQLGLTAEESGRYGKVAGDLYSNNYGDSLGTVNEALKGVVQNIGASATSSDAELQKITASVLDVSTAFDQDLGGTTAAVGQMMKTGMAPNAAAALDIITAGLQAGVDKSGDFMDTMNEYGTQFRKMGLDGATATGLLSQGLQAGARDADLVADAIKEFSIRAVDGSKTTGEGFAALGLNAGEMAAKFSQGGDVAKGALDLTLDRLRAMPEGTDKATTAFNLFGTQSEDLGAALNSLDPSTAVGALGQVEGAAANMGNTLNDNAAARLETFKRQVMTGVTEALGNFLIPALTGVANILGTVLGPAVSVASSLFETLGTWINNNSAWLTPLAVVVGTFAGAIGVVNGAMSLWAARSVLVTGATSAMATAQGILNAVMAINPVVLVVAAIAALAAGLIYAYKNVEWFRNMVDAVWSWMKNTAVAIWNGIRDTIVGVWNWIKGLFSGDTSISAAWNALWGGISSFFSGIWNGIKNVALTVWNWISGFFTGGMTGFSGVFSGIWNGIKAVFEGVWNGIKFVATAIWEGIKAYFTAAFNAYVTMFSAIWNGIKNVFSTIWDGIKFVATTVWNAISGFFTGAFSAFTGFFSNVWNNIVAFFTERWNTLKANATAIWNAISGFFSGAFSAFTGFFSNVWSNILAYFTNVWNNLKANATAIWNAISGFFSGAFSAFTGFFSNVWNNILAYFTHVWNNLKANATAIWNAISGFFSGAFSSFTGFFSNVWNNILNTFSNIWNNLKATAVNLWNGIRGFFEGAFNSFTGFFSNIWNGIVNNFSNIFGRIKNIASDVWAGVRGIFDRGVEGVKGAVNWLTTKVNIVLGFLHVPKIPMLEAGGVVGGPQMLAKGGKVGGGFMTNGPSAIVGEGNQRYPEFVIPTDPKYRGRATELFSQLGDKLDRPEFGGPLDWIGDGAQWVWGGVTSAASAVGDMLGDAANWVGSAAEKTIAAALDAVASMMPGPPIGDMGKSGAGMAARGAQKMIEAAFMKPEDDSVVPPPGRGMAGTGATWQRLWATIHAAFPSARLTDAFSPRPGYHGKGRAIDIAGPSPSNVSTPFMRSMSHWIAQNFPDSREIIHTGGANMLNGRPHSYNGATQAGHRNHVHWAFDQGGIANGMGFMQKATLQPERILSPRQTKSFDTLVGAISSGRMDYTSGLAGSAAGGDAPLVGAVNNNFYGDNNEGKAFEAMSYELRKARRGGRN